MASELCPSAVQTVIMMTPTSDIDFDTDSYSQGSITPTAPLARRPTRKSTLTQQQKNQKRQRATQDQLITLEVEFEKNPTPTAQTRDRIANDISMTERSVQIWFQNRRAKIKNLVKRSIENGEETNDIPDSMKRYLAMQAMETGKALGRDFVTPNYASGNVSAGAFDGPSCKVVIHHLTCRSLTVGSWRRIGQSAMDLVVFYVPEKETITYYINNDSAGYKIEYPFCYIKNITLEHGDSASNAEGIPHQPGGLIVELHRPPHFYMDSSGSGGFYEVGDFTEDQQASKVLVHFLGGQGKILSGQLARLVHLEAYQNRHRRDPFCMPQDSKIAMQTSPMVALEPPAIMTPVVHRPVSQPSHFMDDSHLNVFNGTPVGMEAGLQPPRGHKRQRSRSVPVAVDWSVMRDPMPPLLPHSSIANPSPFRMGQEMVSPIPLYGSSGMHQQASLPLTIDTTAPFPMDSCQYPMSAATTAPSPSDFGTPAFFSGGPGPESLTNSELVTPFPLGLISSMQHPAANSQVTVGPLNVQDPVIANQSPPMTSLGQGPRDSELYHIAPDGSMLADDGLSLHGFEWASKQSLMTLPMRLTGMGLQDAQHQQQASGTVAFLDPTHLHNNLSI